MTWLAIDTDDRRYGAELPFEPYLTNARMNTRENKAWSIFDKDYETYVQKQYPDTYQTVLEGQAEELQTRIDSGEVVTADTLEGLAQGLGFPEYALKESVDRFNGYSQDGADPEVAVPERFLSEIKTPPFYAVVNAVVQVFQTPALMSES